MTKVTLTENDKIKERIMPKPHAHSHKYNDNEEKHMQSFEEDL